MYSSTLPSTSALDGVVWSTPRTDRFTPGERPGTHYIGGCVWATGPVWTGAENFATHRDLIPGPSRPWPVAIPTELSRPPWNVKGVLINEYLLSTYFVSLSCAIIFPNTEKTCYEQAKMDLRA